MIRCRQTNHGIVRKLIVASLVAGLCFSGPAYAGPRAPKYRTPYPSPGRITHKIPAGHARVSVGPKRYHFHAGVFYKRGPRGYAVVRAPLGAVIMHLPVGYHTMIVAGATYFLFAGVYYRRASSGYVVVEAPRPESVQVQPLQQVEVAAKRLNVRSGPGLNHPVVGTVHSGAVLSIQGNAPGWHYVMLANGSYGRVMSKFTRGMAGAAAEG